MSLFFVTVIIVDCWDTLRRSSAHVVFLRRDTLWNTHVVFRSWLAVWISLAVVVFDWVWDTFVFRLAEVVF